MKRQERERLELETARLRLRRPHKRDIKVLQKFGDNWHIASRLGIMPHPLTVADVADWLAEVDKEWARDAFTFVIVRREDGDVPCGVISLFMLTSGRPALGFWLAEPFWRQGLMTEAVGELVRFAFERLQAPSLDANLFLDNEASRMVLLNNGFSEIEQSPVWSRAHLCYRPGRIMRLVAEVWASEQARRAV